MAKDELPSVIQAAFGDNVVWNVNHPLVKQRRGDRGDAR